MSNDIYFFQISYVRETKSMLSEHAAKLVRPLSSSWQRPSPHSKAWVRASVLYQPLLLQGLVFSRRIPAQVSWRKSSWSDLFINLEIPLRRHIFYLCVGGIISMLLLHIWTLMEAKNDVLSAGFSTLGFGVLLWGFFGCHCQIIGNLEPRSPYGIHNHDE